MKEDEKQLLESFDKLGIPKTHSTVGFSNLISQNSQYRSLFENRRLPDDGWSDIQIQHFLYTLSSLDTNQKQLCRANNNSKGRWCGVGEREGRVYSSLVMNRHFGLSHGIGRSGDISEAQPKAVGSSVLARLTLLMVLDAVRRGSGLEKRSSAKEGILLPLCTGMTMSLVLSTLHHNHKQLQLSQIEKKENNKSDPCVLWCRIDQKSCLKAIQTANLRIVVIPTIIEGDCVKTDLIALQHAVEREGSYNIVAILSTTSCFAPRIPDPVDQIAKLAKEFNIAHVINNAYGLQCQSITKLINRACVVGRVDAIIFSMDKNFLVPVGGAVVTSPSSQMIQQIGKVYAGRASSTPMLDLFITLLSMGLNGYKELLETRQTLIHKFKDKLESVALKHNERLLSCPQNTISFGITLDCLLQSENDDNNNNENNGEEEKSTKSLGKEISYLGAMLFTRCVSGTRVVPQKESKTICGNTFIGFGSSTDEYPHSYLTAACAIGLSEMEADDFMGRLDKCMKDFKVKQQKKKKRAKTKTAE